MTPETPVFQIRPIGYLSCRESHTYDVPRQGTLAGDNEGVISLLPNQGFEQALFRLDSFSYIWVLFMFDRNKSWKPMILPPRHTEHKVGVFASRSPYRPSGIGLSCVRLISITGLDIHIQGHDLLDGTPVIDIKPYLPYADAFPDASPGWTAESQQKFTLDFSEKAKIQLEWLEQNGAGCLKAFIADRLTEEPMNRHRNRLLADMEGCHVLAYRTWRILFTMDGSIVHIHECRSGYTPDELASQEDKYNDKSIHRNFTVAFPLA